MSATSCACRLGCESAPEPFFLRAQARPTVWNELRALLTIRGLKGGLIFFCSRSTQSISLKNGCCLMASSPFWAATQPRRLCGFLVMNCGEEDMTSLVTEAWQGQAARERWKSARATSLAPSPKPVSCTSGGLYPPPRVQFYSCLELTMC